MRDNTVCAVVVTYNRKNLLLECLEAIRRQTRPVDAIYIIDNASTDGTPEVLKENGYIPELPPFNLSEPYEIEHKISNLVDGNPVNVFYVRMYENTGSAGGFYEGVKRGYERGYDWLWLMDDDGLPEKDCLMNLYKCTNDLNIVGSLVVASDNSSELTWKLRVVDSLGNFIPRTYFSNVEEVKRHAKNGIYYGIPNFFNSIIIKKDVISIVGFPNKDLFIWGDEVEYAMRLKKAGYKMGVCVDSIFRHPKIKHKTISDVYIYRLYSDIQFNSFFLRLIYPVYIFIKFSKFLILRFKFKLTAKIIRAIISALFWGKLIPYRK
ncbi:Glycosyltransferase, GT2 family [Candidatus Kryptonium thompsonii]|nr:Glycosyltransferase, GT2 family [Candidatus Kryptonium thompsoni]